MHLKNKILLILGVLFINSQLFANDSDFKKGLDEYARDHYHNAIPYFEKVLEEDSTNTEAMFKLGVCYLHIFSFKESLELIEKAVKINPDVDPFQHYWHGRALHENDFFDEAIIEYQYYLDKYTGQKDTRRIEIEKLIAQAKVAKELLANPRLYIVENLGDSINSEYHEHSPMLTKDGKTIIFTTQREYEGHHLQDPDGHFYEAIFISKKNKDGNWNMAEPISKKLEHGGHDANIQLFDDDTKMLVYRQTKQGDFYISSLQGDGSWGIPKPITEINTGSYEVDASITKDGSRMYFATDKYTKERHLNIYYADKKDDGTWGDPVELPEIINSPFDENAPFISDDGMTLYFCSNGKKSMGGYDIFYTTVTADGVWTEPKNLGVPINSTDEDIHYSIDAATGKSYFASHREEGLGEMDIYVAVPVPMVKINGSVVSSLDKSPVLLDSIEVLFQSTDESRFAYTTKDSLKEGVFKPEIISANTYELLVVRNQDTLYKENMEVELAENNETIIDKEIVLDYEMLAKLAPELKIAAIKEKTYYIYFDYDKFALLNEGKEVLDSLLGMEETKQMTWQLYGHTDSKGSVKYNLKLSKNRANTVVEYLQKSGVNADLITYEAKGEEEPIATNDTDEGRAKNRRVEIIITE